MTRPPRVTAGIALVVATTAGFSTLDTLTKFVTAAVPVLMLLWFRYAFQAVLTTVAALSLRGTKSLRTHRPAFQLLRGVLLMCTSLFGFTSLKYMPVGEFTAIVMITPLAITVLAAMALKEKVSGMRWALVAGGFAGTLVIIRPGADSFDWISLLPIALVACNAWFQTLTSHLVRTEDPITMHMYSGWVAALISSLALPFAWTALTPTQWAVMCLIGLLGTVSHLTLILAYQRAPAATLTPYLYSQIAFGTFAGWLVFSHVPDGWTLAGMAIIAVCGAAGAWLTLREARVRLAADAL